MRLEHASRSKGALWLTIGVAVVAVLVLTRPGRAGTYRFLASLRIERPKRVTAAFSMPAVSRHGRRMQDLVARMVTGTVDVSRAEPDQGVASVASAATAAGFTPLLAPAGHGAPTLALLGARTITMKVQRDQLATILREAGEPATVPDSLDGTRITMQTPRGIEARYGDCPVRTDTTLQGQLQGPPPTTAANRDCIVLIERPEVSAALPPGLDLGRLIDIALEVSGMSPDNARKLRGTFDSKATLSLDLPRFVRSHDFVEVRGVRGVLMNQGWRRGPAYTLVWADHGRIYAMSGYGAASEAVPLADSLAAAPGS